MRPQNPGCCRQCNRPKVHLEDGVCGACGDAISAAHMLAIKSCKVCGVGDSRMLRPRRLADGWTLLCANHAAVLGRRWLRLDDLKAECAA